MSKTKENIISRYKEFLKYGLSKEDALYCVRVMFELRAKGFEKYISEYYKKIRWYWTQVIWWFHDHWIDIECSKQDNQHHIVNLAIQCKKRSHFHIKRNDVLGFEYDFTHWRKYNSFAKNILITTNLTSSNAKMVAKEKWIHLMDYKDLLRIKKEYPLDQFKSDRKKSDPYDQIYFMSTDVEIFLKNTWNY